MPDLYCVRADYGKYTQDFLDGGFAAYGLLNERDLTGVLDREDLYPIYKEVLPNEVNNHVIGKGVGQLARFLFEMKQGDYVLTRAADTEFFHWGVVLDDTYEFATKPGHCPYRHRRRVQWNTTKIRRSDLSVPLQNTLRSLLSVFGVEAKSEFFELIGKKEFVEAKKSSTDAYSVALERILTLTDTEFEELVAYLLTAMGFEETRHTGKTGDGGVDAEGTLDVGGLAKIALKVQAKRYKVSSRINEKTVREFRGSIPNGAQGAFITTCDFQGKAHDTATDPKFPRIGLVNGRQLVDLLTEHWAAIPEDVRDKLGLRSGLVLA